MPKNPHSLPELSIFICNRRDDSTYAVDLLEWALKAHFGDKSVFRDVSLPAGADVQANISLAISACRVAIIVIGPAWLTIGSKDGIRRIDSDGDFVRREIEQMFLEKRAQVIPVYVFGAIPLKQIELPLSIANLAGLNARFLRHGDDSEKDIWRLIEDIETTLDIPTKLPVRAKQPQGYPPTDRPQSNAQSTDANRLSFASFFSKLSAPWRSLDVSVSFANRRVYIGVKGSGTILNIPCIAAIERGSNKVLKVGNEALSALREIPGCIEDQPFKDGFLGEFDAGKSLLEACFRFLKKNYTFSGLNALVTLPYGASQVEGNWVQHAIIAAGAKNVRAIKTPIATAMGVLNTLEEGFCSLLLWIGEGLSEAALVRYNNVVFCSTQEIGTNHFDNAIAEHVKCNRSTLISQSTAEDIRVTIGSAYMLERETQMEICGQNFSVGRPEKLHITSEHVREALLAPLGRIVECVCLVIEHCPPPLSAELHSAGLVLAGGGALLHGLDKLLKENTGLPVRVAPNAAEAIPDGIAIALGKQQYYDRKIR